jgi:FAD/FMN-containing dehydrogenase
MAVRVRDTSISTREIGGAPLDALRGTFGGELLSADDPRYEPARRVWNAMVDRRPALIARCLGTADVASVIRFARDSGREVTVRGGGHSIIGHAVADDAVTIDLSLMRGVHIDPRALRIRADGGALIADLDREAQHRGLAVTGGQVPDTGVGGLTLGGGYGWLARRHGLACDNLVSAEVVLADGSVVRTSEDEHSDLFWAIRGGGGNFGVVTSFEFRAHPLAHRVSYADVYYGAEDGLSAMQAFRDLVATAPEDLTLWAVANVGEERYPVPAEHYGRQIVGVGWVWTGERPKEGEAAGAALHRAGKPIAEVIETVDYVALQLGGGLHRPRQRNYWKSSFLGVPSDSTLAAFLGTVGDANAVVPGAHAEFITLGGAISDIGDDATAYGHRAAALDFLALAQWLDPAEDEVRMAAGRRIWEAVTATDAAGVYVNNLGMEGSERVRQAYGATKYDRLVQIKRRYDPENFFRHNQNIEPGV